MVRNYKKKCSRLSWNEGQMHLAVQSVREGNSLLHSSKEYGVHQCKKGSGYQRTFTEEQEETLARYVELMQDSMMGLTPLDFRKLAFDFAERLKIPHNFNRSQNLAGKDWLNGSMSRHDFSHRKAEHTSSARAYGFNETAVKEFFDLLKVVMDKHNFPPEKIFNVDETGISVVPKYAPKILAKRESRQVGGVVAAERGESVTAEICMSAAGFFMPPMLIFPRVRSNPELLNDAPPGAWAELHKSGYMQSDIFTRWLERFITFSQANEDDPVLLLLDGHVTHVRNLDVIELARKNGVIIMCFPPHCTHKMQPLDTGFNGLLNKHFGQEVQNIQRKGVKMTMGNLFSVFGNAFIKAAKMETAINAFKGCGIYPFDPDTFIKKHFSTCDQVSPVTNSNNNKLSEVEIEKYTEVIHDIMGASKPSECHQSNSGNCENSGEADDINGSISNYENQAEVTVALEKSIPSQSSNSSSNESEDIIPPKKSATTENLDSVDTHDKNEVRVPASYIYQAAPLINLLS